MVFKLTAFQLGNVLHNMGSVEKITNVIWVCFTTCFTTCQLLGDVCKDVLLKVSLCQIRRTNAINFLVKCHVVIVAVGHNLLSRSHYKASFWHRQLTTGGRDCSKTFSGYAELSCFYFSHWHQQYNSWVDPHARNPK